MSLWRLSDLYPYLQNVLRSDAWPELCNIHWSSLPSTSDLSLSRRRPVQGTRPSVFFHRDDIARLSDTTGWLNEVCINNCSVLLREEWQRHPSSSNCAVFSTYDLALMHSGAMDALKRSVIRARYW